VVQLCGQEDFHSASPQAQPPAADRNWRGVSVPFSAASITAVGNVFWCAEQTRWIASSSDGGSTWQLKHQSRGGEVLLNIDSSTTKSDTRLALAGVCLLLPTAQVWKMAHAGESVWMFSFADASNGIAVIGGNETFPPG